MYHSGSVALVVPVPRDDVCGLLDELPDGTKVVAVGHLQGVELISVGRVLEEYLRANSDINVCRDQAAFVSLLLLRGALSLPRAVRM